MNILIFIPEISQEAGGVRQYAVALMHILAADESNRYFIYHDHEDDEIKKVLQLHSRLFLVKSSDVIVPGFTIWLNRIKRILNFLSRRLKLFSGFSYSTVLDKICLKYNIDVIHCPYQYTPDTKIAKKITTLHDVQEMHFPEFFTPEQRAYRAVYYLKYMQEADTIIVSYEHVKQDLIKYFSIPEGKIEVVLLNMDKLWFEQFSEKDIIDLNCLNLPTRYLLYPANTWHHKNHSRLLQAMAFLRDKFDCKVNIVFSGHLTAYYNTHLKNEVEFLNLDIQAFFIGVVDEKTLYTLYKSCVGVVVPTLYEAGSFPLVESILLNIPVICSNVTSLPETIGDDSFTFNPNNHMEIANVIKKLWELPEFRDRSKKNSYLMSDRLKNTNSLSKFKTLYNRIYSTIT